MNPSVLTSLALKLSGVVFILSALLDYIVLAIPPQWDNAPWRVGYISGVVDRGIVPLVGMIFILVAYWIDSYVSGGATAKPSKLNLKLPTFLLSCLLGLMFLVFIPLHLSNLNKVKESAIGRIEQTAEQRQQQIQGYLTQLNEVSRNPQLLNQAIQQRTSAIESGRAQGRTLTPQQIEVVRNQRNQLGQLQEIAKQPSEFKKRVTEIKNRLQTELQSQRKQAEEQASLRTATQAARIGLSSLMLTIAYTTIGWFGLRGLMNSGKKGVRPPSPKKR